jgi:ATP phosphoribosyltransferase
MSTNLTLAVPTGRIFAETAELLAKVGWDVPADEVEARKLHLSNGRCQSFILGKDRDVPTYVEHGVADAGIVGADVLADCKPDVYQPLNLGIGRCRMVVAQRKEDAVGSYRDLPLVKVATKYTQVTREYFQERGIPVEVIPLAGSVELAPVLGLADCIVDVVQSGRTLAANGLVIDDVLFESTARLILNRTSFRLKREALGELVARLSEVSEK